MSSSKSSNLSNWLASEKGKVIVNYFYGFGAALVILGALFKIMHFPGAGAMLMTGMGTEVLLFIIGAFEKPHVESKENNWEQVFPVLKTGNPKDNPLLNLPASSGGGVGGAAISPELNKKLQESVELLNQSAVQLSKTAVLTSNLDTYISNVSNSVTSISNSVKKFEQSTEEISTVSVGLAQHYSSIGSHSESIKKSTLLYEERMLCLNDSLAGLNNVYAEQMRTITSQIESITKLHNELTLIQAHFNGSAEESAKFKLESLRLVGQLSELNAIYGKMINAMTKAN